MFLVMRLFIILVFALIGFSQRSTFMLLGFRKFLASK